MQWEPHINLCSGLALSWLRENGRSRTEWCRPSKVLILLHFIYSSEISLGCSSWLQQYTTCTGLDLSLFLSSSQFPMRTLLEYLGSIFHQSWPSFCDAITYLFLNSITPSCWNCPSSYVGERLLSSPALKLRQKGAPLLPARVLGDVSEAWNCVAMEPLCLLSPWWLSFQ